MYWFVLAEKPSVAQDIARAIGAQRRGDGFYAKDRWVIGHARGHLYEISDENAPKEWTLDGLPILPERFTYAPRPGSQDLLKRIRAALAKAERVVIATDPGREGELIARLVLRHLGWRKWEATYRFWTAEALTPEVVRRTLQNLRPASDFDSLFAAAVARAEGDWLVGINLTRAVTLLIPGHGLWSVGRVQTPTLKLLVDREREIRAFRPQTYGVVKVRFGAHEGAYTALWVPENPLPPIEEAERVGGEVRKSGRGKVIEVKREEKREPPPPLHNLASLQKEANARLGFTAQRTLDLAQKLYEERKVISYPRTESRHLPESARGLVVSVLRKLGRQDLIESAKKAGKHVYDDEKLTDHHAIIPLDVPPPDLPKAERALYELIARRFFAVFSGDHRYIAVTAFTESAGYKFVTRLRETLVEGWTREEKPLRPPKEEESEEEGGFPAREGEGVAVLEVGVLERKTKPPQRYSEGALIRAMEKLGLGTPATRASIIETLKERGYVEVKGKVLVPSEKGGFLIDYLGENPVASPELTADWERALEEIWRARKGESGYKEFTAHIKAFVKEAVCALKSKRMETEGMEEMEKRSLRRKATPKMLDYARKLAKTLGWELESDDFDEVKEFIDAAKEALEKPIGECACGALVKADGAKWSCENGHTVWNTFLGARLSREEALRLLGGESVPKRGLKGKSGKKFGAVLAYDAERGRVVIRSFLDDPPEENERRGGLKGGSASSWRNASTGRKRPERA